MIKNPLALVPYLVCCFAMAAGLLWNAENIDARWHAVVSSGQANIGGSFALTDQNGHRRTDADFHGRYTLVYFGYTFCPDVCPTTLQVTADALKKLGPEADKIVPVFITVDPARDKPAVLKSYLAAFGPQFVGLTGTNAQIASVAKKYHVYYARQPSPNAAYFMDHSNYIYLMDPDGRFIGVFDEVLGPGGMAKKLRQEIR
ncbi:MAG TPA: SCO family protein [Rhizomicrobium sp.]|jgi:protein SCO1/2|nr:SCO family protein [Rhizomicrobium sp.]